MILQTRSINQLKPSCRNYPELSDSELISLCQSDDKIAFNELARRYEKMISSLLFRYAPDWQDRSDLMQEVLIRVWRGIRHLKRPSAFKAWLNQIVANIFYDEIRKRSRRLSLVSLDSALESEDGPAREVEDTSSGPDEACLRKEMEQMIHNSMAGLPTQFRTAVSGVKPFCR